MKILQEFREFAVKGTAMDLAIGVIVGAAFQKIVTSLVNDIFMPLIGALMGGKDFSNLFIDLSFSDSATTLAEAKELSLPTLNYGMFLNEILSFAIIAVALFFLVKGMNRLRRMGERKKAA